MRPGILPEHGFKHKGIHYASLPWFGTKIVQKYAIKGSKHSGFRRDVSRDVKPHVLTFSSSGQRQVTTFCTCAVTSRKKYHVSGCRRQAGDVCCLRCLMLHLHSLKEPPPKRLCETINFTSHDIQSRVAASSNPTTS